ncbi:MAG: hypothetical protein WEB78_02495 [Ilumatobacteraceae bacterium]
MLPIRPLSLGRVVTTEGFDIDPDLPLPESFARLVPLGGLHVARHLERFVESLGLHLVFNGSRDEGVLSYEHLGSGYGEESERETRRYRRVGSASGLRRVLRDESDTVPVVGMNSSCMGWHATWPGVRLARVLAPGRLFVFAPRSIGMRPTPGAEEARVYVCAWQAPFPTHAMLAWGGGARLVPGPVEIPDTMRRAAAWMFHSGEADFYLGRWPVRDSWVREHFGRSDTKAAVRPAATARSVRMG